MTVTMLDVVDLYHHAGQEFTDRANRIGDRWSAATPCEDWDVRALVHHIVEEERWALLLLAGATIADVGDRLAGDLLGDAPLIALDDAATQAAAAVAAPDAMERTVHLSYGDVSGREYSMQLAADHLVHAWDLARALDDDTRLDPDAVAAVLSWFAGNEQAYRSAGLIGSRPALPDGAGLQEELLVMFGRTP